LNSGAKRLMSRKPLSSANGFKGLSTHKYFMKRQVCIFLTNFVEQDHSTVNRVTRPILGFQPHSTFWPRNHPTIWVAHSDAPTPQNLRWN
jgi:hypothetical protein